MATAIASTTACVRYRLTRKCLPLNVAIDVNQPAGATGSPENGGHRNRRLARPSTGCGSSLSRSNASSPTRAELNSSLGVACFLAPRRTKVRTAKTDRRRFESKLKRSFIRCSTLEHPASLPVRLRALWPPTHVNRLPRHETGLVAAQKRDHVGDVLWLADAAERDLRGGAQLEGLEVDAHALCGRACHARLHESRRHRVHVDVERAELDRQRASHPLQARLRGRVVGLAPVAQRGGRRQEDHLSVLLLDHVLLRRAR